MKYAKLTNLSLARRVYAGLRDGSGRGLVLDHGETKAVHPGVLSHPKIKSDIDAGVLEATAPGAQTAPKAVPKAAPVAPPPADPPPAVPPEDPPPEEPPEEQDNEVNSVLRALFLDAPGITEKNVDSVLETFSSLQELANADEDALVNAGVSKSFASRVLEWAIDQL